MRNTSNILTAYNLTILHAHNSYVLIKCFYDYTGQQNLTF